MPQQPATSFADRLKALETQGPQTFEERLKALGDKTPPPDDASGQKDRILAGIDKYDAQRKSRTWAGDLPIIGGLAAAALTGGASIPVQMLATGAGGAAGSLGRSVINNETPSEAATNALKEGALQAGGVAVGAGLQAMAPPIMRGAFRLTGKLNDKYPQAAELALAEHIMPTAGGAAKAAGLRNEAMAAQDAAVASHDTRASILPSYLAQQAGQDIQPTLKAHAQAGLPVAAPDVLTNFATQQSLKPSELQAARRVWNDEIGNAATAKRMTGKPIGPDTQAISALAKRSGETLSALEPSYAATNARISTLEGIRQAARGRANIPAGGLDTLAATYGSVLNPAEAPALLAARMARTAPVRGAAAIAINELGGAALDPKVRAAILAILSQPQASHPQK